MIPSKQACVTAKFVVVPLPWPTAFRCGELVAAQAVRIGECRTDRSERRFIAASSARRQSSAASTGKRVIRCAPSVPFCHSPSCHGKDSVVSRLDTGDNICSSGRRDGIASARMGRRAVPACAMFGSGVSGHACPPMGESQ